MIVLHQNQDAAHSFPPSPPNYPMCPLFTPPTQPTPIPNTHNLVHQSQDDMYETSPGFSSIETRATIVVSLYLKPTTLRTRSPFKVAIAPHSSHTLT